MRHTKFRPGHYYIYSSTKTRSPTVDKAPTKAQKFHRKIFAGPKMTRLEDLQRRLAGRTLGDGKPRPGYKKNVLALQNEIRRLSAQTITQTEAVATEPLDTAAA